MATTTRIVCYTDLKDSTALNEQLGNQEYKKLIEAHLALGRSLCERNGGKYLKDMGDAHLVTFDGVENALAFALQLQEMCAPAVGVTALRMPIKVTLFQGAVEEAKHDAFGSAMNQGARLQKHADAATVVINDAMHDSIRLTFGAQLAQKVCTSVGEVELKGITEPPKQHLYGIDWNRYREERPEAGIASVALDHLRTSTVEASNLSVADMANAGTLIWPVVPRDLATAIHRGQVEVIRIAAMLGWRIQVLIADCGDEADYSASYVKQFVDCLHRHCRVRGLVIDDVRQMSELYDPGFGDYRRVQLLFREITSRMSVTVLMALNQKDYADNVKSDILNKPALTHLRPPLTMAAVLYLAQQCQRKCIVVSGIDEAKQWNEAYNTNSGRARIGVLMIPVVRMEREHQILMKNRFPSWHSQEEAVRECIRSGSNVASWLYRLLCLLPEFPPSKLGNGVDELASLRDEGLPVKEEMAIKLVERVWAILDPA